MCDSISIIGWINRDLTDVQYKKCRYPDRDRSDTDQASADFRTHHPTSPLTGAGFTVTPLGMPIPGSDKRYLYGRIAGFQVDVNVPACATGHNRLLGNSVPAAASVAYWLLKYWLALNGCTQEGLDQIKFEDAADLDDDVETGSVDIVDVSLPFLFELESEEAAREFQAEYRTHTEAVLNKNDGAPRQPAFSIPKERPEDLAAKYTYTSYVRQREYLFKAYVKEPNQPNATMLPIEDKRLETEVQAEAERIFRLEVQVHGKWLKDNKLSKVAQWRKPADTGTDPDADTDQDYVDPYEKVFGLVRDLLRLDDGLRLTRLKKTTVPSLPLSDGDKKYLLYHLNDQVVRKHPDFLAMNKEQRSKRYSALCRRLKKKKILIDFNIPYQVQVKQLSPHVADLLVYRGEYPPPEHLAGYMFSCTSFPVVIRKLKAIVANVLEFGPESVPQVPKYTVYNGPDQPKKRGSGISDAPVAKEPPEDDEWV